MNSIDHEDNWSNHDTIHNLFVWKQMCRGLSGIKDISVFGASASEWRQRMERGRERPAKIPVETFPIKKRINTELFTKGKQGFIYKSKGEIGWRWSDQEISDLLEEGRILEINMPEWEQ